MESESFGISRGGQSAEERYREITGAAPTARASMGDAVVDGVPVEIKRASSNTLNQVRAVKYIPLVVYSSVLDQWYVVPAHVVVALVSRKNRGQHTENPFESAILGVNALSAYAVAESDLLRATRDAFAEAARYPDLRDAMAEVLSESRTLAQRSTAQIRDLVADAGL